MELHNSITTKYLVDYKPVNKDLFMERFRTEYKSPNSRTEFRMTTSGIRIDKRGNLINIGSVLYSQYLGNYKPKAGRRFFTHDSLKHAVIVDLEKKLFYVRNEDKRGNWIKHRKLKKNHFADILLDNDIHANVMTVITKELGIEGKNVADTICKWWARENGVKLPNHYYPILSQLYPKLRKLRKTPKLVECVLKNNGIYTRGTNAMFHKLKFKKPDSIVDWVKVIGADNVTLVNDKAWYYLDQNPHTYEPKIFGTGSVLKNNQLHIAKMLNRIGTEYNADEAEKYGTESYAYCNTLNDHLRLMSSYHYYIDKAWRIKSSSIKKFEREHLELADITRSYSNGSIELTFPEEMVNSIEQPIDDYDIVILKGSRDYSDEDIIQRNCVASYVNYSQSSFILSIRDKNGNRLTCEVDYKGSIKQASGRLRAQPTGDLEQVLGKLKKRLSAVRLEQPKTNHIPGDPAF